MFTIVYLPSHSSTLCRPNQAAPSLPSQYTQGPIKRYNNLPILAHTHLMPGKLTVHNMPTNEHRQVSHILPIYKSTEKPQSEKQHKIKIKA